MNNASVISFPFRDQNLRWHVRDGARWPWCVALDACAILGIGNVSQAVARLREHQKGICTIDTLGGSQELLIINLPGLLQLITTSRRPEAQAFTDWIFDEAIPTILTTGRYELTPWGQMVTRDMAEKAQLDRIEESCERIEQKLARQDKRSDQQLAISEQGNVFAQRGLDLQEGNSKKLSTLMSHLPKKLFRDEHIGKHGVQLPVFRGDVAAYVDRFERLNGLKR